MIYLYNEDNKNILKRVKKQSVDLVYADMLYDNFDFDWIRLCILTMNPNSSLFVQTDYRSVAELKSFLDDTELEFVNWIIWPYDWGGRPKNAYGRKHDDILWYAKGNYKFYPERAGIPKKTAKAKKFNPSGRDWKIPTDVWDHIGNFHTMDKERIKDPYGDTNIRWQKPLRLLEQIILPCTDVGDMVLDPFMGTGTTGEACINHNRHFIGFELDIEIFKLAEKRLIPF